MPDFGIFRGFSEKSFGDKLYAGQLPTQLGGSTDAPDESGWERPSDWLPMPTGITSNDQIFVGLHAVIMENDNYVAFLFTTSTGQYQVDWGDGTVTLHNSNTKAEYQYNFATYDVNNTTLCSRGYKQAIITVTPVSGNLLTCNFQQRYTTTPTQNQQYSTGFLDCILSMPNANSGLSIVFGNDVRHSYVERFDIKSIGNCTIINNLFAQCYSLQSVPLFNTQNVTQILSMFANCFSLKSVPLFNTENVTVVQFMFQNCISLESVPLFNTQNVTNISRMLTGCFSLKSVPLFNTQNVTNFQDMLISCWSLKSVPQFNTNFATNMSFMFADCFSLKSVPSFNTQNVTTMNSMFRSCQSLNSIPALSTQSITTTSGSDFGAFAQNANSLNRCQIILARTVSFANCQLSRDAIVEIFNNLVDRTSTTSATITITGNWGVGALSAADLAIATNKNWVVTT